MTTTNNNPTRLETLASILGPIGYSVDTWHPGDGVTRYRFFSFAGGDYFAHDGITAVLGFGAAETMAHALRAACGPLLRQLDSDHSVRNGEDFNCDKLAAPVVEWEGEPDPSASTPRSSTGGRKLKAEVRRTMASRHAFLALRDAVSGARQDDPEAAFLAEYAESAAEAARSNVRGA